MLITRFKATFQGFLAFTSGHIDYDEESEVACVRALEEKCGVDGSNPILLCLRGKPERYFQYHMVSIVFLVENNPKAKPVAQDDAASAE